MYKLSREMRLTWYALYLGIKRPCGYYAPDITALNWGIKVAKPGRPLVDHASCLFLSALAIDDWNSHPLSPTPWHIGLCHVGWRLISNGEVLQFSSCFFIIAMDSIVAFLRVDSLIHHSSFQIPTPSNSSGHSLQSHQDILLHHVGRRSLCLRVVLLCECQ